MPRTRRAPQPGSVTPNGRPDPEADGPVLQALNRAGAAARIALRGVRLTSRLSGMSQRTTLEQTFVNSEPEAIEAVYTFPLPEGAAVCGFEVVTGDRVLTGQVEEAEKAIDRYEQAVGEGHGAFVMEQDRPDVFTVRVGNLKPRQAATIRLTYVCPLEKVDRQVRVAFPTTVAPRYVTDTATDPLQAMIDGDALNPPHVLHVPYGMSMDVEIDLGRELKGVSSPSHAIRVEPAGRGSAVRVTFAGGVTEMNRDVVLSIELKKEHEPSVQAERGKNGESYLAVTFVPEFDVDELGAAAPGETVFVLDCSGSMQGDSIRQATAALELCLRAMSEGDTFNVCRFGSTFELMASEPLRYSQETLDRAIAFVRRGADLGGTELHAPLQAILRAKPVVGQVRQVVLLTDGQVTNEPACIDLARRNRGRNRIFSFGIGSACSAHLVKGLARATGGAAEFITAGERIDDKVLRTFSRLASPMVSDVSLDWDGAEVQTLAELPPVFDGDVLAVFGRAAGRPPAKVTLSCMTQAGPQRWTVPVPPPADHGGVIPIMWARRTIQSLEEVNDIAGSRARPAVRGRERDMLLSLSREFGLLCSVTTFIAIEHRTLEERNDGRPALRRVPVQLAKGWGAVEECLAAPCAPCQAPPAGNVRAISLSDVGSGSGLLDLTRESDDTDLGSLFDKAPAPAAEAWRPRARGAAGPQDAAAKPGMFGALARKLRGAGGGAEARKKAPPTPPAPRATIDKTLDRTLDRTIDKSIDRSIDKSRDRTFDAPAGGSFNRSVAPEPHESGDAFIHRVLSDAVRNGAAEVQLEPTPHVLQVRIRIDGRLVERASADQRLKEEAIRSIRSLLSPDPTAAGGATGEGMVNVDGQRVSIRVDFLTTPHGEAATLHILKIHPAPPDEGDLKALLSLQRAEGWFAWSGPTEDDVKELVRRSGYDPVAWKDVVRAALPAGGGPSWDADRAARTASVLCLFILALGDEKALWQRAYVKGVRYLAAAMGKTPAEAENWLTAVKAKVAAK